MFLLLLLEKKLIFTGDKCDGWIILHFRIGLPNAINIKFCEIEPNILRNTCSWVMGRASTRADSKPKHMQIPNTRFFFCSGPAIVNKLKHCDVIWALPHDLYVFIMYFAFVGFTMRVCAHLRSLPHTAYTHVMVLKNETQIWKTKWQN